MQDPQAARASMVLKAKMARMERREPRANLPSLVKREKTETPAKMAIRVEKAKKASREGPVKREKRDPAVTRARRLASRSKRRNPG